MATSNVTLTLNGLLVLTATEGEYTGEVGVLGIDPDGHRLKITVTRKHGGADIDIPFGKAESELSLQIEPPKKISVRDKTNINRLQHPVKNLESIRWFVDLDDPEFFRKPVGAERDMFDPILKFNGGELYTAVPPNDSILDTHKLLGPIQHRGRVALVLGVFFKNSTRAIFKNGGQVVFDSNNFPGDDFEININHNTDDNPPSSSDANWYYLGLGGNVIGEELLFSSNSTMVQQFADFLEREQSQTSEHRRPPTDRMKDKIRAIIKRREAAGDQRAGSEAACFPAYLSKSKLT